MDTLTTKVCAKCGVEKSVEAYDRHPSGQHGCHPRCKPCRAQARKRDTVRSHQRDAKAALREEGLKRCLTCGEVKLLTDFYRNRAQADGRAGACKTCDKARYMARPLAERTARLEKWRKATPEAWAALGRKAASARRARLRGAFVEQVDPFVVFEAHGGVCGICGEAVARDGFDVDHIVPLALGGEHSYANAQPAHAGCNRSKGRLIALAGKEQ